MALRDAGKSEDAVAAALKNEAVVLVRPFTEAEDVAGFNAAAGPGAVEGEISRAGVNVKSLASAATRLI